MDSIRDNIQDDRCRIFFYHDVIRYDLLCMTIRRDLYVDTQVYIAEKKHTYMTVQNKITIQVQVMNFIHTVGFTMAPRP